MEINGSSAIITGGASGLGEATARKLATEGVRVTVFDRNEERAKEVVAEIGGSANYVAGDVTDPEDCQKAVDQAADGGNLRIAVNCAGTGWVGRVDQPRRLASRPGTVQVHPGPERHRHLQRHDEGRLGHAPTSSPRRTAERGVIVNTASVAAFDGQIGQLAYSASKGAVVGMTLPAARDLAVVGIRVLAIAPGLFDTPLLAMLPDEARDALAQSVNFPKRLGNPVEYGELVAHIATNSYLNAEVIRLDGGIRMPPK